MRTVGIIALMVVGTVPAASADPPCPAGFIMFVGFPTDRSYSTAAVRESTSTGTYAGWNLPAGHIQAEVIGGVYSEVQAVDRFVVIGPPPGTPLAFIAKLRVQGWIGNGNGSDLFGDASVYAHLQEGSFPGGWDGSWMYSFRVNRFEEPGSFLVDTTLTIVIQRASEEEFELSYSLLLRQSGHGYCIFREPFRGDSQRGGLLSFEGLPAGASVASCQGFAQGTTVPTLQSTWGAVKSRYR